MAKRVLAGRVAVDSGQVIICDPCYLIGNFGKAAYQRVCDTTLDSQFGEFLASGFASGVVSGTADGDGVYPVYATLDRHGRVRKLEIEF